MLNVKFSHAQKIVMKNLFRFSCLLLLILSASKLHAQNVMINVQTKNSGVVKRGEIIFFEITISNTSPVTTLPMYKIRPQISFPVSLVSIPEKGHVLPEGWTIVLNKNGVVTLSNGTDAIPENASRTVLIALKGNQVGGPAIINANLLFSNAVEPGMSNGAAPKDDKTADNFSTSSIRVL